MKVICDVCGTTFADTATHCPICGCAKSPAAKTVAGEDVQTAPESSTAGAYAKGGRFAKSNVKRNANARTGRFSEDRNRRNEPQQGNKGLIAVVIVLLLAIIMVVVYIGVTVFLKDLGNNDEGANNPGTSAYQDNDEPEEIPCTFIKLNCSIITFDMDETIELTIINKEPENTTDTVSYVSADPEIATVDANGMVKPGTKQGETVITVTCGEITEECKIISTVGEAPEEPEPEVPEVVLPEGFVLTLKTYQDTGEITLSNQWPTAVLYKETMGIKASDITWTISDPSIVKVENGKAIGLDHGTCTITATIGDQTATCRVICRVDPVEETAYALNITDVTLYSDSGAKSFTNIELKEIATGAKMQVEWKVSKEGVVEITDSGKITACTVTSRTTVNVYTEYEGVTYTCIVRVEPKETEN